MKRNSISGKLHKLSHDFLVKRKQRVVLNEQVSSWASVKAGVPQCPILGPLLFLIYINGLLKGFSSNPKFFAYDVSLLSVINNSSTTRNELNDDLVKISFNADLNKQAQETIFSRKTKEMVYPPLT